MNSTWFEFEGKRACVRWQVDGERLWIHFLGQTQVVNLTVDSESTSRGRSGSSHPGRIPAPMPGKVTKVHVVVGQTVAKGQPLLVMEAMKMEYTLAADMDGVVEELNTVEGDQVTLGKILVRVSERESRHAN